MKSRWVLYLVIRFDVELNLFSGQRPHSGLAKDKASVKVVFSFFSFVYCIVRPNDSDAHGDRSIGNSIGARDVFLT